ncbi:MAG: adenylyl-sulfate kinase [Desulfobacterales bacterium]|nr:adenylyl-sulfate kinase [Desulfobacterales bacterium]
MNKPVLWLMGPTSSGKTTISKAFLAKLTQTQTPVIHYDGDEIRNFFGSGHGFTSDDRFMVIKTLVHLAKKASCSGLNTIVSALTAEPEARMYVSSQIGNLHTILVKSNISECVKRDPKGLYKKAISGEITTLIGYNSEYIMPISPNLILDTNKNEIQDSVDELENYFLKL